MARGLKEALPFPSNAAPAPGPRRQTIIDLSLRYCPCFKSHRARHGGGGSEDPDGHDVAAAKQLQITNPDDDPDATAADSDIDARIAGLQARIAELATILEDVASS